MIREYMDKKIILILYVYRRREMLIYCFMNKREKRKYKNKKAK